LFTTINGIYDFNANAKKQFYKNSEATSMITGAPDQVLRMCVDAGGNYFVQLVDITDKNGDDKGIAFKSDKGKYKWNPVPLRRIPPSPIYSMLSESNGITWLGNSDGLYRYDANFNKNYHQPFNALIRSVLQQRILLLMMLLLLKKTLFFWVLFIKKQKALRLLSLTRPAILCPKLIL